MIENVVQLDKIVDIQDFVNLMGKIQGDVTVYSGKYIIDGKSIMGLMSLDLSTPVRVKFEIDGDIPIEVREGIKKYLVR